jgi:hypothetical protein
MYLSSFDTYWVNWCVELYQRLEIVNLLRDKLNCYEKVNKEDGKFLELFCTIVGKIHRACSESFGDFDRRTQNKKVKSIIEHVCLKGKCELFKTCKYNDLNKFRTEVVEEAYEKLKLEAKQCGLLHPVMREELRIFGERRSPIIDELKNRYVIRKSKKEEKIFAVPYNANISFIVYRKELLQVLKGSIDSKALRERIIIVYKDLVGAGESAGLDGFTKVSVEETAEKLAVDFREKTDYVPETWEEVISLCELGSEVVDKQLKFLIETRTFDTFACTLLELVWSTGKRLRILPDYSIDQKGLAREILFRAFYTLYLMFDRGIIPRDSCLEPEDFAAHSSRIDSDWLFARHWYSTLIDVLSGKHESNGREHELIWQPDSNVKLDIMPIPVSLSWYTEQWRSNKRVASEEVECENGKFVPKHASCWGEWYLGIMKGTENEKLAIDLINNLMSSRKVYDRAFSCAALPTMNEFYEMYGDAGCFNLTERDPKLLPDKTYNSMRSLFEGARSRTDIFDYRHCMRELHSILEYVRQIRELKPKKLMKRIDAAIERIETLGGKQILVF